MNDKVIQSEVTMNDNWSEPKDKTNINNNNYRHTLTYLKVDCFSKQQ